MAGAHHNRPSAARSRSPETVELDGTFTKRQVADTLRALRYPNQFARLPIRLDRDVRDLLVAVLDR